MNPEVEGRSAVFTWHGTRSAGLVGDFKNWDRDRPLRLKKVGSRRWQLALEFPEDAYIEYAFELGGERVADPQNPQTVSSGVDSINHYFYMPKGGPTPWLKRPPRLFRGRTFWRSLDAENTLGGRRKVDFYRPAGPGPYRLLVVFDGQDYLRRARLPYLIDALAYAGRIQPPALAMIHSRASTRSLEYRCNDATLEFVVGTVLPAAREELDLIVEPGPTGAGSLRPPGGVGPHAVLGASWGGLIALYTALRRPDLFGDVLAQSGGFEPGSVVYDFAHRIEPSPLRVWMDVGNLDFVLEDVHRMKAVLEARGANLTYREYSGGHSYTAWRDDLPYGLQTLFTPVEL
jgi:enterochelin esterase family protein